MRPLANYPLRVEGQETTALIDTGADGDFISENFVKRNGLRQKRKANPYSLNTIDEIPYRNRITRETEPLEIEIEGRTMKVKFDIAPISKDVILGDDWLRQYDPDISFRTQRILGWRDGPGEEAWEEWTDYPKQQTTGDRIMIAFIKHEKETKHTNIPKEYRKFAKLFEEPDDDHYLPEHKPWDHEIPLIEGKQPTFKPIYRLSTKEQEVLKDFVETNLKRGRIRPSTSPAGYPILFVKKKGTDKLRLCVDYRQLNEITIKNRYALPLISDLQDKLAGAMWFTTIDLRDAYYMIRIKEGDEWKTAFRTKYGHYEFLVMPFGLTNAPATFQSLIDDTLRERLDKTVLVYLDDILIYTKSKNLYDHIKEVEWVMTQLQSKGLRVNPDKCEFHKQEVIFLGYKISREGISMDPAKCEAVQSWKEPENVKEVLEFNGFCNFYRKLIKNYSGIATPLTNLTKKDQSWHFGELERAAFQQIKKEFVPGKIMATFDPDRPQEVAADASDYAMGAELSQVGQDGKRRPVAFFSKKFSDAELNYEIHDKELLAIVRAMEEWRHYLEGAKYQVVVYSDHHNLTYFTTTKELTRRQARWYEALSKYDFVIKHRKGSLNGKADALSRKAEYRKGLPKNEATILTKGKDGLIRLHQKTLATAMTISLPEATKEIKEAQEKDSLAQRVSKNRQDHPSWTEEEGVLLFRGLIYLPEALRREYVSRIHGLPMHGHQGITKTLERVSRNYYFPGMRPLIESVISQCHTCNTSKSARHKPYGKLQPNEAPQRNWQIVTMDFITKLPKSKESLTGVVYDSILVIIDRLSKYALFVPYLEASNAEQLADTVIRVLVAQFGMPNEWITDRDKLFTSTFWKSLMAKLGTHHKLSTSFHPQTDGQTERVNQIVEQYIRCFTDYGQTNWVRLLPMAQFAYNSAAHEVTKLAPFKAILGYIPEAYHEPILGQKDAHFAEVDAQLMKHTIKQMSLDIQFFAERNAHYYNTHRLEGPRLKEGDKVYLSRRNIKTTRPSDKLDYKRIGPFEIEAKIGEVNYRLKLPKHMRIHPVFHVALLEPAPHNAPTIAPQLSEENEIIEYEVEDIIDQSMRDSQTVFRVRWKGYDETDDTWEPEENLQNAKTLLRRFQKTRTKMGPQGTENQEEPRTRTPKQRVSRKERRPPRQARRQHE